MLDNTVCLKIDARYRRITPLTTNPVRLALAILWLTPTQLHAGEVVDSTTAPSSREQPGHPESAPLSFPRRPSTPPTLTTHLPHLLQVRASVYSGGTPVGRQGFAALQRLGVRTIVSVDGAKPRIDLATQFGLRYIHIPIGYDGITDSQKSTLGAVFTRCRPPYYFHCHHGKHRGPAALAAALCTAGTMTLAQANDYLQLAGVSRGYQGLWNAVADASKRPPLPTAQPLIPMTSVSTMVAAMAAIDPIYDNLKLLKKNNWQAAPDQPDVTSAHQSLMLLELLKELPRTIAADQFKKPLFLTALSATTDHAARLQRELRKSDWASASKSFEKIRLSCVDCHADFRN